MKSLKFILPLLLAISLSFGARKLENLDRGLVAMKTSGGVFLSWRVLGTDAKDISFNVYRDGTKITASPVTGATNMTDAAGTITSKYTVRAIVGGVELPADAASNVWPNFYKAFPVSAPPTNSLPSGGAYTYNIADGSTGDLDGDGKLDIVFIWNPSNMKDNSLSGYTGNVWMDGYTIEGKRLFRIDLGKNIRAGCHYTQFVVADFDADGKAEIMVKTAPGTKDGSGSYLSKGSASGASHTTDYRNSKGYILSGPEWLTVFRGSDGKELATVDYNPGRGTVSSWGDSYGNRVDRFLAAAAWLDGTKPSGVFQRGYYTRMAVTAWDWDGTTLKQRWYYNAATKGSECYGQGNHNLSVGDVDGDGKDEIIQGACAIDHDGKFMYRTGLGHGDAMHLGDLDPDNAGLEVYTVHEETSVAYGYEMHDAKTGKILWGVKTGTDNGRGIAADVDAANPGHESWSFGSGVIQSAKGANLSPSRGMINFRVYWDGDLLDETLEYEKVQKLVNGKWTQILTLGDYGVHANDGNKYTPLLSADILGDWREEIIMGSTAMDSVKIFSTNVATAHKLYTLMHDPVYRAAISWQNTAYNQPPHLGFWLGAGVDKAPTPAIELVGAVKTASLVKASGGLVNQTILLGDTVETFAFNYVNCTGATVTGLPAGVKGTVNASTSTITIQGTPTATGTFAFTISTTGGTGADQQTGTLIVVPRANVAPATGEILSNINAAVPFDGMGAYEEKNAGWIDSGYYNFTNSMDSYGMWKLSSEKAGEAVLTIRFANGGVAARNMDFEFNGVAAGAVPFAKTTNWTTWDSVGVNVVLSKGLNTIRLGSMGSDGGPNVDQFYFDVVGVTLWSDSSSTDDGDTTVTETPDDPTAFIPLTPDRSQNVSFDESSGIFHSNVAGMVRIETYSLDGRLQRASSLYVQPGATRLPIQQKHNTIGLQVVRVLFDGVAVNGKGDLLPQIAD